MKTRKSCMTGRLLACVVALATLGLSSCQSDLCSAAERGDVNGVRLEFPGTSARTRAEAADIAYKRGNTAVLDELARHGVGVAPDVMSGKVLVLQADKMGETSTASSQAPELMYTPDALSMGAHWKLVNWTIPGEGDACRVRNMSWARGQQNKFAYQSGSGYTSQSYTRTGSNTAVACDSSSQMVPGTTTAAMQRWFKYELKFETPTSGKFWGYQGEYNRNVKQLMGRFWVKGTSAQVTTEKKVTKPTPKKRYTRRRGRRR